MRKIFTILTLAMVTIVSCQKEPEAIRETVQEEKNNDLVGTKWVTSDFARQLLFGGNPMMTYEFLDNTHVDIYTTDNNVVVDFDETTTYDYDFPKLVVHQHTSDGVDNAYEYEFKDKYTIIRIGMNEYSPYMKFTKVLK